MITVISFIINLAKLFFLEYPNKYPNWVPHSGSPVFLINPIIFYHILWDDNKILPVNISVMSSISITKTIIVGKEPSFESLMRAGIKFVSSSSFCNERKAKNKCNLRGGKIF